MSEDKKVLLEVQKVKKEFVTSKSLTGKPLKIVHAVDSVDLTIYAASPHWAAVSSS